MMEQDQSLQDDQPAMMVQNQNVQDDQPAMMEQDQNVQENQPAMTEQPNEELQPIAENVREKEDCDYCKITVVGTGYSVKEVYPVPKKADFEGTISFTTTIAPSVKEDFPSKGRRNGGRRSRTPELCKERKLVINVRVLETPYSKYRGDLDDLERVFTEEYRRRLSSETPKFFFTLEHMKYLIDKKFFPGKAEICWQNLQMGAKIVSNLIREKRPDLYKDLFKKVPHFAFVSFPCMVYERQFIRPKFPKELQDRGAFVICDGNAEIVVDHTTMFEGNGFLSALFCLCAAYAYFETPKPKEYTKTYTVLEKLTFAEKLPSRSEEASFIKSILDSFDEPENPVLVSSECSDTWVLRI